MLSREQIEQAVRAWITKKVRPGYHVRDNGEMSQIDFEIDRIEDPLWHATGWEVRFRYTVFVLGEFSYDPDNPPSQSSFQRALLLNEEGLVIDEREEAEEEGLTVSQLPYPDDRPEKNREDQDSEESAQEGD